MNRSIDPAYEALELEILDSGVWGTIGPHSVQDAAALAAFVGAARGLLCHSGDAAYEALLRAFGCAHGDRVIMPAVCSPMHALVAVCTGAAPTFCPVGSVDSLPDPDALDALLDQLQPAPPADPMTPAIRCVVCDYPAELSETASYPLDRLSEVCSAHGLPLILDAGGFFSARWKDRPLTDFADAVIRHLGEGSEIYAGRGGFIAANSVDVINGAFAYHNCGRGMGDGCSLNFDAIVGGDFRVTEWTAAAAGLALSLGDMRKGIPQPRRDMTREPLYDTEYFHRMTGA